MIYYEFYGVIHFPKKILCDCVQLLLYVFDIFVVIFFLHCFFFLWKIITLFKCSENVNKHFIYDWCINQYFKTLD